MLLYPIYLIFIPIITSLFIYLFHNKYVNYLAFLSQVLLIILSIQFFIMQRRNPLNNSLILGGWSERIGIELKNDIYSLVFIFLSIFIWSIIILYCFDKRRDDSKFLFFLLFLEGAFLALIQSNDLFNIFILIEIITILSTILIIYKKDGFAVRAGIYYLLFNSVGIIFFLLGTIIIYNTFGTLNIDIIKVSIDNYKGAQLPITFSYTLFIAAIGVKSALFPVFAWLPKAHGAAPSSISGLLSGLIVKLGVILFIRIHTMFSMTIFDNYFFIVGVLSAFIGVIFALSQKDIKQILAYHTISQLGIIFIGLSSPDTFYGGVLHIINHAFFKTLLFLGVGIIIRNYNIRRVTEIRGVFKNLPITSLFLIIGMLSISGAPFLNGYISKSIISYEYDKFSMQYIMFYIINIGTAASFIKFSQIFFGSSNIKVRHVKLNELMSLLVLAIACLFLGLFYQQYSSFFFTIDLTYIKLINIFNFTSYIFVLLISYLLYKNVIKKDIFLLKKIRHLQFSFETINYLLVLFYFSLILWAFIFI